MNVNQLPSIPILAIRHLRKRIKRLTTYAHVDTAVTLRSWCTTYGGHTKDCAHWAWKPTLDRLGKVTKRGRVLAGLKCTCGWAEAEKELTTFSDEFYEKFRKKAS